MLVISAHMATRIAHSSQISINRGVYVGMSGYNECGLEPELMPFKLIRLRLLQAQHREGMLWESKTACFSFHTIDWAQLTKGSAATS